MGPHHGLVSAFYSPEGKVSGYLELKLHYDQGDLELWLAKDRNIKHPFDLSLESTVTVTFLDHWGKSATLRIRNTNKNEDEDGNRNIRDNRTNYFIFPGTNGAESKWLMGKGFKASVVLSFSHENTTFGSDIFTLVPH